MLVRARELGVGFFDGEDEVTSLLELLAVPQFVQEDACSLGGA